MNCGGEHSTRSGAPLGNTAVRLVINNSNFAEDVPLQFIWRMRRYQCEELILFPFSLHSTRVTFHVRFEFGMLCSLSFSVLLLLFKDTLSSTETEWCWQVPVSGEPIVAIFSDIRLSKLSCNIWILDKPTKTRTGYIQFYTNSRHFPTCHNAGLPGMNVHSGYSIRVLTAANMKVSAFWD
jgi:hypothetical protein